MGGAAGWLRRRAFGLSRARAMGPLRGVRELVGEPRRTLERIVDSFVSGYHAALEEERPALLASRLRSVEPALQGFAYEGAGMGLWLLDSLSPWRRGLWSRFTAEHAPEHDYLLHVGAGWALARLRQDFERRTAGLDPLLRWLLLDGRGFHDGFFDPQRHHFEHRPPRLSGEAARVFDQGLGRSLWFVAGADPERVVASLAGFAAPRRADLWSGVGLACAYAGGGGAGVATRLQAAAGAEAPRFAQGVAFAAAARVRAGHLTPETEGACREVWGESPAAVASRVDRARVAAERGGAGGYSRWRAELCAEWERPREESVHGR